MPTNWITHPSRREWVEYERVFSRVAHRGSGYRFPCDAAGNVATAGLTTIALENLRACLTGFVHDEPMVDEGIQGRERAWYDSGSVRCNCGAEHHLERGDSVCGCGQHFNAVGQELCHPSLWEG